MSDFKAALLEEQISSSRLVIRPLMERDFQYYQQIFSDLKTTQFTGGLLTKEELDCNFNNCLAALKKRPIKYLTFAVETKTKNSVIGIATLVWQKENISTVELGVILNQQNLRRGYCIELVNTLLTQCFEHYQIETVISFTLRDNIPAQQALTKLGFYKSSEKSISNDNMISFYWVLTKADFKRAY